MLAGLEARPDVLRHRLLHGARSLLGGIGRFSSSRKAVSHANSVPSR